LIFAAAFLMMTIFLAGAESPFKLDFYGHYKYSWLAMRADSLWNPSGIHDLAARDSALLLQTDGRLLLGKLRLRGLPLLRVKHDGGLEGRLREAVCNLNLGNFDLTAGKALIKLGTGYIFSPISVITPQKQLSDPEDSDHQQEGVWLVKADYYRENFSISAMVFRKGNWSNLAIFAFGNLGRLDLYAIVYYPENRKLEFGLAASGTAGESVELHGELMLRSRSPVLSHMAFSVPDGEELFVQWPLFQPPDRFYPELLLGTSITVGKVNLIAEYYHSGWGISRRDYRRLGKHFTHCLELLPDSLAGMNMAADLEFLQSVPQAVMSDYFFARACKTLPKASLSALTFLNLADGSFLVAAEASFSLFDNTALYLRPLLFSGKKGTQYGDSVYRGIVQTGFSATF
jgi:hypothetical protein